MRVTISESLPLCVNWIAEHGIRFVFTMKKFQEEQADIQRQRFGVTKTLNDDTCFKSDMFLRTTADIFTKLRSQSV